VAGLLAAGMWWVLQRRLLAAIPHSPG